MEGRHVRRGVFDCESAVVTGEKVVYWQFDSCDS